MNVIAVRNHVLMVEETAEAAQVQVQAHVTCLHNVMIATTVEATEETLIKVPCEVQVHQEVQAIVSAHINLIIDKIYIRIMSPLLMMILCKMRIFR
jgi:hypothetical protein